MNYIFSRNTTPALLSSSSSSSYNNNNNNNNNMMGIPVNRGLSFNEDSGSSSSSSSRSDPNSITSHFKMFKLRFGKKQTPFCDVEERYSLILKQLSDLSLISK